jgi:hypothetical protein
MPVSLWFSSMSVLRGEQVAALAAFVLIGLELDDPFLDTGSGEL